jgi:FAD synthetase
MLHNSKVRIMVFGTFDILHKGHLNFLKQARAFSRKPYLIVSVAKSRNVRQIKGNWPLFSEKMRMINLKKIPLIDRVVLGATKDYIAHICKEKPDIIALGYDQRAYTKDLKKMLNLKGLFPKIVRLKPYRPEKYKTSLLKSVKII